LVDTRRKAVAKRGYLLPDSATSTALLQVRGLTQVAVAGEEEALSQFFTGEQARSTARHVLNSASSRSHALFSVALEMRTSEDASERAVVRAGCPRAKNISLCINLACSATRRAAMLNSSATI
jgi:hypothetical protein